MNVTALYVLRKSVRDSHKIREANISEITSVFFSRLLKHTLASSNYIQLKNVKNNMDPSPMYTKYWPAQYSHCNFQKLLESLVHLLTSHFQALEPIFLYFWLKKAEIQIDRIATKS